MLSLKEIMFYGCFSLFSLQCLANSDDLQTAENSCSTRSCSAGDKGITSASKEQPYFACPTREAAQERNAENLLIIQDKALTQTYKNNWLKREQASAKLADYQQKHNY